MKFEDKDLLLEFVRDNKKLLIFIAILSCISAVKGVYFPVLVGNLPEIFKTKDSNLIKKSICYIVGIFVSFTILSSVWRISMDRLGTNVYNFFFKKFFNTTILNLEKNFTNVPTSDFYGNILKYIEKTKLLFYNLFNRIGFIAVFISTSYFFGKRDKVAAVFFLMVNIILLYILFNKTSEFVEKEKNVSQYRDTVLNLAEDINTNIPSITSFNNIELENNNIKKVTNEYTNLSFRTSLEINGFITLIKAGFYILLFGMFAYFYQLWQNKKIPYKELISILLIIFSYLDYLWIDSFINIPINKGVRKNSLNKLNLYYQNIDTTEIYNPGGKNSCLECVLSASNINFKYANGKPIFNNLSVSFYPKQVVSIIGKNGSGKSTLIKILFGIIRNIQGGLFVYGHDTSKIDIRKWRSYIHYCQQNPVLFNRTVDENLFYNNELNKVASQKIIQELEIQDTIKNIQKTTGPLGISGRRLSGGQRQIIALLRIILKPKPIVLLDEPTSALDHKIKDKLYGKTLPYIPIDMYNLDKECLDFKSDCIITTNSILSHIPIL